MLVQIGEILAGFNARERTGKYSSSRAKAARHDKRSYRPPKCTPSFTPYSFVMFSGSYAFSVCRTVTLLTT